MKRESAHSAISNGLELDIELNLDIDLVAVFTVCIYKISYWNRFGD